MKKLIKSSTAINQNNRVFTPDDVKDLLTQIDELKHYNIKITETRDGVYNIAVGQNIYQLSDKTQTVYCKE